MTKTKQTQAERTFADLVDLAESGEPEGRVLDAWFGKGTLWRRVDLDSQPGVQVFVAATGKCQWVYEVDRLLHDEKLRASIRQTAAMRRLPDVAEGHPVKVSFKSEGDQRGQPVGPVTVFDLTVFDADPVIVARRAAGEWGVPFGYTPQGQHGLGWQTLAAARKVAKHYGVELEEW